MADVLHDEFAEANKERGIMNEEQKIKEETGIKKDWNAD